MDQYSSVPQVLIEKFYVISFLIYDNFFYIFLAVFMAELTKLLTCLVLVFMEEGTATRFKTSLHNAIIKNKLDTVSEN